MSRYLRTKSKSNVAIAVCDRCKMKCALADMIPDGDSPGIRVCGVKCRDNLDPYKLPARQTEDISLRYPRPDVPVST